MTKNYTYKTKPFPHQEELFERTKDLLEYALFWEQGCGKTKPTIDTAGYLYRKGIINALLVVAPSGVHRNWISDEIPAHLNLPAEDYNAIFYQASKSKTKWHAKQLQQNLEFKGLAILTVNYECFTSPSAKQHIWDFLKSRKVFYVLDEAHYIKTPKAKRTQSIIKSGRHAVYKRILTGTPITQGPFDAYSEIKFLDSTFWTRKGFQTFVGFKNNFGIWRKAAQVLEEEGFDPGFDQLLGYQNIEQLSQVLKEISSRLTKESAGLKLPPKLYSKHYFEMTPEQSRMYKELEEEFIATLGDVSLEDFYKQMLEEGFCEENALEFDSIEASLAIVRQLRLQQITCNYVPVEKFEDNGLTSKELVSISDKNPRLEALKDICEALPHDAIIWARFKEDISQIMELLGDKAVQYDGSLDSDEKAQSKERFTKDSTVQFFVANPQAGATGLTLTNAKTVIYYSNSYNLNHREQSEDRAHRIGQDQPVHYIDIVAPGTMDEKIISSLVEKKKIAVSILGDEKKEWL